MSTTERPSLPFDTLYAMVPRSEEVSSNLRPMKRLIDVMVFSGLVMAWFFALLPTMRSPSLRNATTDGVVRSPSAFTMIVGSPPSRTATAEFVVPRSIPMILPMSGAPFEILPGTRPERLVHEMSRLQTRIPLCSPAESKI